MALMRHDIVEIVRRMPDATARDVSRLMGGRSMQVVYRCLRGLARDGVITWRVERWDEQASEVGRPRRRYRLP